MSTGLLAGAIGASTLTGCGGLTSVAGSPTSTAAGHRGVVGAGGAGGPASIGGAATAAGNRAAAEAEAVRLRDGFAVPVGATPAPGSAGSGGPAEAAEAADRTPPGPSRIVRSAVWRVATSLGATSAWVRSHPAHGLAEAGAGSASDGSRVTEYDYTYPAPSSSAWIGAEVYVTVTAAPQGGAYLRVEGQDDWLDPTPLPDDAAGRRVQVSPSGPCPSSDSGVVGITNGPGLTTALVPDGRPTGGLVCRYDGLGPATPGSVPSGALRSETPLDAASAQRLAAAVAAVPVGRADLGVRPCPMDNGARAIVALSYPGRSVDVWIDPVGCGTMANGSILVDGAVPGLPGST